MSAAAPPLRSRRGLRRYLPLALGVALLSVTIGVERGVAPSADSPRPAAVTVSVGAGQDTQATADQDIRPVAVVAAPAASEVPEDAQQVAPSAAGPPPGGVAVASSGPRAPPLPRA